VLVCAEVHLHCLLFMNNIATLQPQEVLGLSRRTHVCLAMEAIGLRQEL
jgi:hypothetical protein